MNTPKDLPSSTAPAGAKTADAPELGGAAGWASVLGSVIALTVTAILHSWYGQHEGAILLLIIAALLVHDHDRNNDFKKLLKIARDGSDCLEHAVKHNRELIKIIADSDPEKTYFKPNIAGQTAAEKL